MESKKFCLTGTHSTKYTLYCNLDAYMYMHVSETKALHGNTYLYHLGYSENHIFNFLLFLPLHVSCDSPNAIHNSVMNQYLLCLAT